MAALAFLVIVAWVPQFTTGEAMRWIVLSAGLALVSPLKVDKFPLPFLLFWAAGFVWMGLGLSWSPDPWGGFGDLVKFALLTGAMIAVSAADNFDRLMFSIAVGLLIATAVALVELMLRQEPLGLFGNRDFLAEAAAPVLVWALLMRGARVEQFFVIALGLAVALVVCGSRTAFLMIFLGLLAGGSWCLAITALPALALWTLWGSGKVFSLHERLDIWRAAISHMDVRGHGLGWFFATWPHWEYAHSDLLQALVELGVGAALFLLPIAWLLYVSRNNPALRGGLVASVVGACGSFTLHEGASGFVSAVMAGGVVAAWHRQRSIVSLGRTSLGDDGRESPAGSSAVA